MSPSDLRSPARHRRGLATVRPALLGIFVSPSACECGLLHLLVRVLRDVEKLADGRGRLGMDLDEVESLFESETERPGERHDAELLARRSDHVDARCSAQIAILPDLRTAHPTRRSTRDARPVPRVHFGPSARATAARGGAPHA